mgnify:FL=1
MTKKIKIHTEFIKLDQAIKLADIGLSGGTAKVLIQEGKVKVNGEVCLQRGKKLHVNDTFEVSLDDENLSFEIC